MPAAFEQDSQRFYTRNPILESVEALAGVLGVVTVVGARWLIQIATSTDAWVLSILISKPLVDLTWRAEFMEVWGQRINFQTVVALVAVVLTFMVGVFRRDQLVLSRYVVALQCCALLSTGLNFSAASLNECLRFSCGLCFFFVAGNVVRNQTRFDQFVRGLIFCCMFPVVLGLFQALGVLPYEYFDWIDGQTVGRVSGTYQHPLGLIYFVLFVFPFALYLLHKADASRLAKAAISAAMLLSSAALVLTYHRTGLIAVGTEISLWYLLTGKLGWRKIVFVFTVILLAAPLYVPWLAMLYDPTFVGSGAQQFLRGRGLNWILFMTVLLHSNPFYWMIGKGGSLAEAFIPGFGMYYSDEPHNDFVRILYVYGVLGLCLYVSILYRMFKHCRILRRSPDPFLQSLGTITLSILPAFLLMSMTGEPLRYPTGAWYLFVLASILEVQSRGCPEVLPDWESELGSTACR